MSWKKYSVFFTTFQLLSAYLYSWFFSGSFIWIRLPACRLKFSMAWHHSSYCSWIPIASNACEKTLLRTCILSTCCKFTLPPPDENRIIIPFVFVSLLLQVPVWQQNSYPWKWNVPWPGEFANFVSPLFFFASCTQILWPGRNYKKSTQIGQKRPLCHSFF